MEALTADRGEDLMADTILELLANRRRRYILYALEGRKEPAALSRLAETVAGWEHGVPPEEVAKNEYKSVYVSSVQCHVPKLHDAGVVDHDESDHTVVLAENFEQLRPYLRLVMNDEPPESPFHSEIEFGGDGVIGQIRQNVARLGL